MLGNIVLALVVIAVLIIIIRIASKRHYYKCLSKIPGPKGKPVVGNWLDVLTTPEQLFLNRRKWTKEFGTVYKVRFLTLITVTLSSPEDAEVILTSKAHDKKGYPYQLLVSWLGNGLLLSEGEKWKSRRRILTHSFHFNILQEFVNIFNKETENLIQELEKHCEEPYIDVMKPVNEFTLCSIIETSMGIHLNSRKTVGSYKKALVAFGEHLIYKLGRPWLMIKPLYRFSKAYKHEKNIVDIIHKFSDEVIEERKKTFDKDFKTYAERKKKAMLDLLLSAQLNGENIDDVDIREEVDTFLFGGQDTTSTTICHTLMVLANEPQIQEDILQEIHEVLGPSGEPPKFSDLQQLPLMERCIKEVLRIFPSIPQINRVIGEDVTLPSGYTLPKGTNIYISMYDLHRNPDVWENPTKFDPDRFLPENVAKRHTFSFIPFSAGSRNCLGQKYGMFEIKSALCAILRKFRLEAVDTPDTMAYKSDIVLRPVGEIKVKFVRRK